jgi:DNA-directed RNA polymerase specialized sigma24 family protein
MSSAEPISHWIGQLKGGDHRAAQALWEAYCGRLVALARSKLAGAPRRAADEEDVALSAFDSFCRGAERQRFPRLDDRDDLWQVLVVITGRKALRQMNRERAQKRGGGKVWGETEIPAGSSGEAGQVLAQVLGDEPTPDFAAEVADECRRLLSTLGEADLRNVALWKMEGYTTEEIAGRLGCVPRTVERKLGVIRGLWEKETAHDRDQGHER